MENSAVRADAEAVGAGGDARFDDVVLERSVESRTQRAAWTWATLAALIAVGAYLRLVYLGRLGIHWDEDLSALAVKAILANGVPELPSGMIYLRGGPFLYAMAASAQLLGFGELALRLPAALFGIATIPLAFALGKALFSERVGLVAAALLTISVWDVELARYARMYAPFIFFYMATLLCLWRYRVQRESLGGGMLCVALALIAVSLHELGYSLAPAMFFPLILRGPKEWLSPRRLVFPLCAAAVVAVFFFAWSRLIEHLMTLPLAEAEQALAARDGGAEASAPASALPHVPLLANLLGRSPAVFAVLAAALIGGAALFAFRRPRPMLERLALIGTAAAGAFGVLNVALLGVVATAWLKRRGLPAFRTPELKFALGVTAASVCAWLLLTVLLGLAEPAFAGLAAAKAALRWSLLNFPHFFAFWGYPNQWPMASVPAAIGALVAFDRASRRPSQAGSGFLLLALATPLILNGVFATRYELFRYDVPFDTLYFCLISLGLLHWREIGRAWGRSQGGRVDGRAAEAHAGADNRFAPTAGNRFAPAAAKRFAPAAVGALLALLVLAFDLNPVRPVLVAYGDYRNEGALYGLFGLGGYPDYKTPALYVAEHRAPEDRVIVLDSREMYAYLGRVDYWVMSSQYETQTYPSEGSLRDLYVSTPLIRSASELEQALAAPGGTKWLIASDAMLAETRVIDDDVKGLIRSAAARVVYVGRDGDTKVYRFP
ncbi:MAG TPA: glycosyltransferase family 39 protein [Gammaproteobacteria bacterium]|nr:glycosyltransferase family 39 protein [Gammaproteobacteria bacterium]